MIPRPYAIVAYSPASSTAATTSSVNRSMARLFGAVRVWRDALPCRRLGGRDDGRAAVRLVLLHDEWRVRLLPELGRERQLAPGEDGRDLHRDELGAYLVLVERGRLLDGGEQSARRLVAERLVPLGLVSVLLLEPVDEFAGHLVLVREQRAPPHGAEDVLDVLLA